MLPLYLTPLYSRNVLTSKQRVDSHTWVAEQLCDYGLRWRGGLVDTKIFHAGSLNLPIYSMQYGDEVEISPLLYENFSLVHMSLRGTIEVEADGERVSVPQGRVLISSPRKNIRLRWEQGCEQLIMRVPHQLLRQASSQSVANPLASPPQMCVNCLMPRELENPWIAQINAMMSITESLLTSPTNEAWLSHYERGIALFLLSVACEHATLPTQTRAPDGDSHLGTAGRSVMDRLDNYIQAKLGAPVTLDDLARAAGVGRRRLYALCHHHVKLTPMVWLRSQRLEAARQHLERHLEADVTAIALRFGFENGGRFAAQYRARFGELPSQTRHRILQNG